MNIKKLAEENYDLVVKCRRHIHENPELSGVEFETLKYIKSNLEIYGIPYQEIPEGGILGFIEGGKKGKTVLLRGDIDALPIQEPEKNLKNVRVCRSKVDGVMHACGHDAHTSMLLVAGKILSENKEELEGNVILCFEQGEEGGGNIMQIMRYFAEGKASYDVAYGMHVDQRLPYGKIALILGGEEAGLAPIDIRVKGIGGHGSRPDLSNNPIDCMMQIATAIKGIRMKYIDPYERITVGINVFQAGRTSNVIPEEGILQGSARYFSIKNAGEPFNKQVDKICKLAAKQFDCEVINKSASKIGNYPVYNNEEIAALGQEALKKHIDPDVIGNVLPQLTSESFSHYGMLAPAVYANLGVTNAEYGSGAELHNQYFDIDETALKYGVMAYLAFAYEYLKAGEIKTSWELPSQQLLDVYLK